IPPNVQRSFEAGYEGKIRLCFSVSFSKSRYHTPGWTIAKSLPISLISPKYLCISSTTESDNGPPVMSDPPDLHVKETRFALAKDTRDSISFSSFGNTTALGCT